MSNSIPNTDHEEFLDLCALSTSGNLTPEEQKRFHEHLADCSDCRQALKQFETLVDKGIPTLAADLAGEFMEIDTAWSVEVAEAKFFKRLSQEKANGPMAHAEAAAPLAVRLSRSARADGRYFWLPIAAAILLFATLGILTYRTGLRQGVKIARIEERKKPGKPEDHTFEAARREAVSQLAERDKAISELQREMIRQSIEHAKLKALQTQQQRSLATSDEEKTQLAAERNQLAQQVAAGEAALQASDKRLASLEQERSAALFRSTSLQAEVADLSRALNDEERTTGEQQELLAKDRDIRELMGARDLYITEVYDVARTGETQRAFGRVFYTKGKSLIFYAYDLNDQPGLKEASTFEAWGRRGPDWTQAFKLGVFYEDNESKKRWVLKSNDKKTLDQIDAVFVTVEPHGGSELPTGKRLLFAYLRVSPNHP